MYAFKKECYIKNFDTFLVFEKRKGFKDMKDIDDEVFV